MTSDDARAGGARMARSDLDVRAPSAADWGAMVGAHESCRAPLTVDGDCHLWISVLIAGARLGVRGGFRHVGEPIRSPGALLGLHHECARLFQFRALASRAAAAPAVASHAFTAEPRHHAHDGARERLDRLAGHQPWHHAQHGAGACGAQYDAQVHSGCRRHTAHGDIHVHRRRQSDMGPRQLRVACV